MKKNKYTLFSKYPLIIDPDLACLIGLNEAIILQQIYYWLIKNEENNKNFHEGKYWTYNSIPEWQKQFPFFSYNTIKRTLKDLEDKGIIISGHFHEDRFNKTKWYAIDYLVLEQLSNSPSDRSAQNELIDDYNILTENKTKSQQIILNDRSAQNELIDQPKMSSCYTETNKQRLTKEEEEKILKKDFYYFQPSEDWKKDIKDLYGCSDKAFQIALDEFREHYSKYPPRSWAQAFETWCRNRKIWEYKGKDQVKPQQKSKSTEEMLAERQGEEREIMEKLAKEFGPAIYTSWIDHLKLLTLDEHKIRFSVRSNFIKEWITTNYLENIMQILNRKVKIEIV